MTETRPFTYTYVARSNATRWGMAGGMAGAAFGLAATAVRWWRARNSDGN